MKYSWHPWAIYLLFPFKFVLPLGDKIYDAITHLAGEELDLEVYVCPRHRDNRVLIALLGMTIWLAGLITAIVFIDHNGMLYGLLLFVIANVCVRLLAITPRPTYIGERYGTFRGTAAAFLDQLQPKPRLWMPTVLNL
ncbi:MAG: hypothetical protein ACRD2O_07150 [Terriglobia bacterium]